MGGDTEPSSFFREPEPASWTQVTDMGMIMWGMIRADGGLPPWASGKEQAMSSPYPETFYMPKKGEGDLLSFSDLDLTPYARTELSWRRRGEGGTSLPDRVEATMGMIMHMVTLATDENTRMGREALHRVKAQWGRPFQSVKEGINFLYVTNKRVAETEAFEEEFMKRFNADLMRLGGVVRMMATKLRRRGNTWPTAREAG